MRVFALSDVHVDYRENMDHLDALSSREFQRDALILAGDVTDDLDQLAEVLAGAQRRFGWVFFVPGNHELWVRRSETRDSVQKFHRIVARCAALGISTQPTKIPGVGAEASVWIVPLFSWYVKPEEGAGSLFVEKSGDDASLMMWADNHLTGWAGITSGQKVADFFLDMNEKYLQRQYDAPIVSFSHFLPRRELMFANGVPPESRPLGRKGGRGAQFNFSRVAGSTRLDGQIRALGSRVHVYGHQHRNRDLTIGGVRYVSNCLGYPHERDRGETGDGNPGPKVVWDTGHRH